MFRWLSVIVLLVMPVAGVKAAVTISEVAWMGTIDSANDEWIELYNDGPAVALDGWQLTDGINLTIDLAGTMAANSYAVLERTDDTSAPGTAFLIYTGALSNTGATLTLRDENGVVVDQMAGGEDWEQVGGDNTTKETAQLTERGWSTAAPTPGQANNWSDAAAIDADSDADVSDDSNGESNASVDTVRRNSSAGSQRTLHLEPRTLQLAIDAPREVYVNQPVTFEAAPSGLGKVLMQSLRYDWNFGDLHTTRSGATTSHRFAYPGRYVVSVFGRYKQYQAEATREIVVLPQQLSINQLPNGDVQVHNDGMTAIDISGYRVAGVMIPPRTRVVSRGTLTIPVEQITRQPLQPLLVRDSTGAVAASEVIATTVAVDESDQETVAVATPTNNLAVPVVVHEVEAEQPKAFSFASEDTQSLAGDISGTSTTPTGMITDHALAASVVTSAPDAVPAPTQPWLYVFAALLFGLVVGIYTRYL